MKTKNKAINTKRIGSFAAVILAAFCLCLMLSNVFADGNNEQNPSSISYQVSLNGNSYNVKVDFGETAPAGYRLALYELNTNNTLAFSRSDDVSGQTFSSFNITASEFASGKLYYVALTPLTESQLMTLGGRVMDTSLGSVAIDVVVPSSHAYGNDVDPDISGSAVTVPEASEGSASLSSEDASKDASDVSVVSDGENVLLGFFATHPNPAGPPPQSGTEQVTLVKIDAKGKYSGEITWAREITRGGTVLAATNNFVASGDTLKVTLTLITADTNVNFSSGAIAGVTVTSTKAQTAALGGLIKYTFTFSALLGSHDSGNKVSYNLKFNNSTTGMSFGSTGNGASKISVLEQLTFIGKPVSDWHLDSISAEQPQYFGEEYYFYFDVIKVNNPDDMPITGSIVINGKTFALVVQKNNEDIGADKQRYFARTSSAIQLTDLELGDIEWDQGLEVEHKIKIDYYATESVKTGKIFFSEALAESTDNTLKITNATTGSHRLGLASDNTTCYFSQGSQKLKFEFSSTKFQSTYVRILFQNRSYTLYRQGMQDTKHVYSGEYTINVTSNLSDIKVYTRVNREITGVTKTTMQLLPTLATSPTDNVVNSSNALSPTVTQLAANGSTVTVQLFFNQRVKLSEVTFSNNTAVAFYSDSGISDAALPTGGTPYYYFLDGDTTKWYIVCTLPQNSAVSVQSDNTEIAFSCEATSVSGMKIAVGVNNVQAANRAKYYAPITYDNVVMKKNDTVVNFNNSAAIVKHGDIIELAFTTTHPVAILENTIDFLGTDTDITLNSSVSAGKYKSIISFEIPLGISSADLKEWLFEILLYDELKQEKLLKHVEDNDLNSEAITLQYYAPIEITDVKFESGNLKSPKYAKNGDTITVFFTANHEITAEASIVGKNTVIERISPASQLKEIKYCFKYILADGNVIDLAMVGFEFEVFDEAENTSIAYSEKKVAGDGIKYYSPITAETLVYSSNKNTEFAKNGDMVTVEVISNHETFALKTAIGGRGGSSSSEYSEKYDVIYTIPENEGSLSEGDLAVFLEIEDPAGNVLEITQITNATRKSVIYDRTAPEILISNPFCGFGNSDIQYSIVFKDEHLQLSETILVFNSEKSTATEKINNLKSHTMTVSFSKNGEYRLTFASEDMAGNTFELEYTIHAIVDKNNPSITIKTDKNTFPVGFTLDKLFVIDETYLKEIICTITDAESTHSWEIDKPIDTEGKKTLYMLAKDMAGNTSVPITYDFYIDGTAPLVEVAEMNSGKELFSEKENVLAISKANLIIGLKSLHVGTGQPDKFVLLQLLDGDGKLVKDFLKNSLQQTEYEFELPAYGKYTLVIEAVDDAGNTTQAKMSIEYRQQNILEILFGGFDFAGWITKNPAQFVLVSIIGIAIVVGAIIPIVIKVKKRKNA